MKHDSMILENRPGYFAVLVSHYDDCNPRAIPHGSTYLFQTLAEARAMFPGVSRKKWTPYTRVPASNDKQPGC